VLHAILLVPVTLLGLAFMMVEGVRWTEVRKLGELERRCG